MKKLVRLLKRPARRVIDDAVVVHIDIVGSTSLIRECLEGAHRKIDFQYGRIERICRSRGGLPLEVRGDAVLLLFDDPTAAFSAAVDIQQLNYCANLSRFGLREPEIRIGISKGPIILDERMATGEVIIRSQRLEQLACPGEVMVDRSIRDALDTSMLASLRDCGNRALKGFPGVTPVFATKPGLPTLLDAA